MRRVGCGPHAAAACGVITIWHELREMNWNTEDPTQCTTSDWLPRPAKDEGGLSHLQRTSSTCFLGQEAQESDKRPGMTDDKKDKSKCQLQSLQ